MRAAAHPVETVPSLPEKILIVRLGAIGDVVNALVLAAALKRHEPRVRIGWAVHSLVQPLVEGHPDVDRVHSWPRDAGLRGARALLREVRAERYDLAIDAQRITKSALLARLSGAPRVLGYDRARCKEASWLWTRERVAPGDPGAHVVLQYLELAWHLGVPEAEPIRRLPQDPAAEAWAEAFVRGVGAPPVLLNVGASKPQNRWPPRRFGQLAFALRANDVPVVLTGGPEDREAAREAFAVAGDVAGVHDLAGATTLLQFVALARRARLFVGCDTGPMHAAAAVGTPVVALFGPADPGRTGPFGAGHRVILPTPSGASPQGAAARASMEDLSVAMVVDAVSRAIVEAPPRA